MSGYFPLRGLVQVLWPEFTLSQYDRIGLDTTPSSSAEKPKIEREDADTLDGLCVTFARFRVASAGRRRQHDLNIRIFLQGIDEWANREHLTHTNRLQPNALFTRCDWLQAMKSTKSMLEALRIAATTPHPKNVVGERDQKPW